MLSTYSSNVNPMEVHRIGFERSNIIAGLNALASADYHMSIPVTREDFADSEKRERWRKEKNMIVLRMWSDSHRRTPVDVFIYEPFDFRNEYAGAEWLPMKNDMLVPVVGFETLLKMKEECGRPQDLIDVIELKRILELKKKKNL